MPEPTGQEHSASAGQRRWGDALMALVVVGTVLAMGGGGAVFAMVMNRTTRRIHGEPRLEYRDMFISYLSPRYVLCAS